MKFNYSLDERPDVANLFLGALQWLAVGIPSLVIITQVMNSSSSQGNAVFYLQKLLAVTAITLLLQVTLGHRLPLIIGPSNIILVAILTSQHSDIGAVKTALIICGLLLAVVSLAGLFNRIQGWFTPRVVAVILLLVAFAITPTIRDLIIDVTDGTSLLTNLLFALIFLLAVMTAQRFLKGVWQSSLIFMALIVGTGAYYLLVAPTPPIQINTVHSTASLWSAEHFSPSFDPGVIIAFTLAFLALSINDLGSIQSMSEVLQPNDISGRCRRGLAITGVGNAISGWLGVVGPVNFSFSTGIVMSTGNASRFTIIPTAIFMLVLAFLPRLLGYFMAIPSVVIGCVLLYVMVTQVATGLLVAFNATTKDSFTSAMLIALPVLIGVVVAFIPAENIATIPPLLRTILGNGFIVGIICSLLLEHVIYRSR